MPSKTKAQHNFMEAVAHNPAFAKKVGVPQSVGAEFSKADKGRKFERGGDVKESKQMMKKEVAFMKKKGAPKSMIKHEMAEAKMNKGGAAKKYAKGGSASARADGVAQRGKTKGMLLRKGGMAYGSKC